MTKWILGVLLSALLAVPAVASAGTTIIEPEGSYHPYQRWIDHALAPTPEITIKVVEQWPPCGDYEVGGFGPLACTYYRPPPQLSEIDLGWKESAFWAKGSFFHELGHLFDITVLPEWKRVRFQELGHANGMPWDEGGFAEEFAEGYAACSLLAAMPADAHISLGRRLADAHTMQRICWRSWPFRSHLW